MIIAEIGGRDMRSIRAHYVGAESCDRETGEAEICRASPGPKQFVAVLDFGAQYGQLIARRVRDLNVYLRLFLVIFPQMSCELTICTCFIRRPCLLTRGRAKD